MRRVLTLFTGTKLATAAAAGALSVVTTLTLVAGGIVVSHVVNTQRDHTVAALPAVGAPLAPIVIERNPQLNGPRGIQTTSSVASAPSAASRANAAPFTAVSLVDDADHVTGSVRTALDAGEPTRMDEVTTIDRIRSIVKGSEDDETTSEWDPLESTCRHASLSIL